MGEKRGKVAVGQRWPPNTMRQRISTMCARQKEPWKIRDKKGLGNTTHPRQWSLKGIASVRKGVYEKNGAHITGCNRESKQTGKLKAL